MFHVCIQIRDTCKYSCVCGKRQRLPAVWNRISSKEYQSAIRRASVILYTFILLMRACFALCDLGFSPRVWRSAVQLHKLVMFCAPSRTATPQNTSTPLYMSTGREQWLVFCTAPKWSEASCLPEHPNSLGRSVAYIHEQSDPDHRYGSSCIRGGSSLPTYGHYRARGVLFWWYSHHCRIPRLLIHGAQNRDARLLITREYKADTRIEMNTTTTL